MEYLKARPTIYNGIQMRSRLEAQFAEWMDGRDWRWTYEPSCYASPDGQYLPDFLVEASGAEYFVEIKPTDASFTAAWLSKGDIIRASLPDAHFGIVVPSQPGSRHGDWLLHTREPFSDLVEWVTGTRDPVQAPPPTGSRVWLPEGPEVNAVLAMIHAPKAVGLLLDSHGELAWSLFSDDTNREAFMALVSGGCLEAVLDESWLNDASKDLLRQLAGHELDGEPEDAVAGLVREAARRAVETSSDSVPFEVHEALLGIHEPLTKRASVDVLLDWLETKAAQWPPFRRRG